MTESVTINNPSHNEESPQCYNAGGFFYVTENALFASLMYNQGMIASELIILLGTVVVGAGIYVFFRQRARLAQCTVAIGIVTDLIPVRAEGEYVVTMGDEGRKIERKYRYRPEIRFKTHAGRTIDFIAPIASRPPQYAIGDPVEVIYDPQNPKSAQINSFLYLWFNTLMLVGFGLFTIGMGLLGVIL